MAISGEIILPRRSLKAAEGAPAAIVPAMGNPAQFFTPPKPTVRGASDAWQGPLQPPRVIAPPGTQPRGEQYYAGQNMIYTPRAIETWTIEDLRAFASYPLIAFIIDTISGVVASTPWQVRLKPVEGETNKQRMQREKDDSNAKKLTELLQYPNADQSFRDFIKAWLTDTLEADCASIYMRRNRGGDIYDLRVLDGNMISRVLDANGWTPQDGQVAYRQLWYGTPMVDLSTDQLVYRPMNPRSYKLYGESPTEKAAKLIQIGIQKLDFLQQYYENGSIPDGIMIVPPNTPPKDIEKQQQWMNSTFAGNLAKRVQLRLIQGFVPLDSNHQDQLIFPKEKLLADELDNVLIRQLSFAFKQSPQRLLQMNNRSTAQQSQQSSEEEGQTDYLDYVKDRFNYILFKLGYKDYEFLWAADQETDPLKQAQVDQIYVGRVKTVNELRKDRGLDPRPEPECDMIGEWTMNGFIPISQAPMMAQHQMGQDNADGGNGTGGNGPGGKGPGGNGTGGNGPGGNTKPKGNDNTKLLKALVESNATLAEIVAKYSDDQPRDDHGRWTDDGGGAAPAPAADKGSRSFTLANGRKIDVSYDPKTQEAQLATVREEELAKLPAATQAGFAENKGTAVIFKDGDHYTPERTQLHNEIIEGYMEGHQAQARPEIAMVGGGPASGKTTAANEAKQKLGDSIYVNVDDIRAKLPEYGALVGGNRVGLINHEIGDIRDQILAEATNRKFNVVLDGVGSPSAAAMLSQLNEEKGYRVSYSFVYRPVGEAEKNASSRALTTKNLSDLRDMPDGVVREYHEKARTAFPLIALPDRELKVYNKTGGGPGGGSGKLVFWRLADGTVKVRDEQGIEEVTNGGTPKIPDRFFKARSSSLGRAGLQSGTGRTVESGARKGHGSSHKVDWAKRLARLKARTSPETPTICFDCLANLPLVGDQHVTAFGDVKVCAKLAADVNAGSPRKHKFANTQINLPPEQASQVTALSKAMIPDEDLAGDGREMQPHVTLKYGVDEDLEDLAKALDGEQQFEVELGNVIAFTPSEHSEGAAPIVVEVVSEDLPRLHDLIHDAIGVREDNFDYKPHMTLAYVKPEAAAKYAGKTTFVGVKIPVTEVTMMRTDGTTATVNLDEVQKAARTGIKKNSSLTSTKRIVLDPHKVTPQSTDARRKLESTLKKGLNEVASRFVLRLQGHGKVKKADDQSPDEKAREILDDDAFWTTLWTELPAELAPGLEDAARAGATNGMLELDVNVSEAGMIQDLNQIARDYSQGRAAEMVGMKYTKDGTLIPNPDAKWVISDTTRNEIRKIITEAFEKKTQMTDLVSAIQGAGAFSNARAEMIARTEVSLAQVRGNAAAWTSTGLVQSVVWQTSNEPDVCDECLDNADSDPVEFGAPFPSGDLFPPAHPNCRCVLVVVMLTEPAESDASE